MKGVELMKNYVKPIVIANDELSEGIYTGSGTCYTFNARIVQKPDGGVDYYTIQIDGQHAATDGHHSTERTVVITFTQPVTYLQSNAISQLGSGTNTLTLTFKDGYNGSYHNNAGDNIGLGQLTVKTDGTDTGLAITSIYCSYCNNECGQHTW